MKELFHRLSNVPILTPADIPPSRPGLIVRCVLNPGAFLFNGRIGLLMRVCEQPPQEVGSLTTLIRDDTGAHDVRAVSFDLNDPKFGARDSRTFIFDHQTYLTTLSHLRLAWSDDGVRFDVESTPFLEGRGLYEEFGVEDCRVVPIGDTFHLTYTAVSRVGVAVGRATTTDFRAATHHGLILPPHNKDCVFFPQQIGGKYVMLHRPSGAGFGGHFMWMATSPDLANWGDHRCLMTTRRGMWDSERIGVNSQPILTERGWLIFYHGADTTSRYSTGAILVKTNDPTKILARTEAPLLQPVLDFEKRGFFPNVIFSNGHVLHGDQLTVYYGAADEYIGAARASFSEVLASLG